MMIEAKRGAAGGLIVGHRGCTSSVAVWVRLVALGPVSPCIFRPSPLSGDGLIEFDLLAVDNACVVHRPAQ